MRICVDAFGYGFLLAWIGKNVDRSVGFLPKLRPRRKTSQSHSYCRLLGAFTRPQTYSTLAEAGKQEIEWRQIQTLNQKSRHNRIAYRIVRIRIARIAKS